MAHITSTTEKLHYERKKITILIVTVNETITIIITETKYSMMTLTPTPMPYGEDLLTKELSQLSFKDRNDYQGKYS